MQESIGLLFLQSHALILMNPENIRFYLCFPFAEHYTLEVYGHMRLYYGYKAYQEY